MKVVFDTNELVMLMLQKSECSFLFNKIKAAGISIVVSPSILDEVKKCLIHKKRLRSYLGISSIEQIEELLNHLSSECELTNGDIFMAGIVPTDPNDDHIIATAVEGKAQYIISEDSDLLNLKEWYGIRMLSRDDFLKNFDQIISRHK